MSEPQQQRQPRQNRNNAKSKQDAGNPPPPTKNAETTGTNALLATPVDSSLNGVRPLHAPRPPRAPFTGALPPPPGVHPPKPLSSPPPSYTQTPKKQTSVPGNQTSTTAKPAQNVAPMANNDAADKKASVPRRGKPLSKDQEPSSSVIPVQSSQEILLQQLVVQVQQLTNALQSVGISVPSSTNVAQNGGEKPNKEKSSAKKPAHQSEKKPLESESTPAPTNSESGEKPSKPKEKANKKPAKQHADSQDGILPAPNTNNQEASSSLPEKAPDSSKTPKKQKKLRDYNPVDASARSNEAPNEASSDSAPSQSSQTPQKKREPKPQKEKVSAAEDQVDKGPLTTLVCSLKIDDPELKKNLVEYQQFIISQLPGLAEELLSEADLSIPLAVVAVSSPSVEKFLEVCEQTLVRLASPQPDLAVFGVEFRQPLCRLDYRNAFLRQVHNFFRTVLKMSKPIGSRAILSRPVTFSLVKSRSAYFPASTDFGKWKGFRFGAQRMETLEFFIRNEETKELTPLKSFALPPPLDPGTGPSSSQHQGDDTTDENKEEEPKEEEPKEEEPKESDGAESTPPKHEE